MSPNSSHLIRFHFWGSNRYRTIKFILSIALASLRRNSIEFQSITCHSTSVTRFILGMLCVISLSYGNVKVIECRTCRCLRSLCLSRFSFPRNCSNEFSWHIPFLRDFSSNSKIWIDQRISILWSSKQHVNVCKVFWFTLIISRKSNLIVFFTCASSDSVQNVTRPVNWSIRIYQLTPWLQKPELYFLIPWMRRKKT